MPSATALRIQIEHSLQRRFPAALTPRSRTIRETAPTGISAVDALLQGGVPVGAISEIVGAESSGRTSLALSFLTGITREERVCAWVDAGDALDAESAAASGVNLRQLLWVRCRREHTPAKPWERRKPAKHGLSNLHPSNLDPSNLDLSNLDQALRATDLLLQAGGFAAIVLDLASTPPGHASRIPLATWFRFRQAADRTRCSLLVLARQACAQSSAAVVLECAPLRPITGGVTVLNGFRYEVASGRQRFSTAVGAVRKPPASTWSSTAAWQRDCPPPPVTSFVQRDDRAPTPETGSDRWEGECA